MGKCRIVPYPRLQYDQLTSNRRGGYVENDSPKPKLDLYKVTDQNEVNLMSAVLRRNRKGSDRDITRLNSLGFSLSSIGERLSCHPTSITLRLKSLKITPADTRRAFMEDILHGLPPEYQEKIADLLEESGKTSIKSYVRDLISTDIANRKVSNEVEELV